MKTPKHLNSPKFGKPAPPSASSRGFLNHELEIEPISEPDPIARGGILILIAARNTWEKLPNWSRIAIEYLAYAAIIAAMSYPIYFPEPLYPEVPYCHPLK